MATGDGVNDEKLAVVGASLGSPPIVGCGITRPNAIEVIEHMVKFMRHDDPDLPSRQS
jgi:hypothetical protein